MSKKTFYQWIRYQVNRDDMVGDLARDAVRDKKIPKYVKTSHKKIENYLNSINTDNNLIDSFRSAWEEYIEYI